MESDKKIWVYDREKVERERLAYEKWNEENSRRWEAVRKCIRGLAEVCSACTWRDTEGCMGRGCSARRAQDALTKLLAQIDSSRIEVDGRGPAASPQARRERIEKHVAHYLRTA